METGETTEFSLKPTIEQTPFQDKPTQLLFTKWCEVNGSIVPAYVSREEWKKKKGKGMLGKDPDQAGKRPLFLPVDLKLWEMVTVIEIVDKDTFPPYSKKRHAKRREFNELGESFVNAGIYLAQHCEKISTGQQTAEATARDLYSYGNALRTGKYTQEDSIQEIADNVLSDNQRAEVDTWFGVDKLAAKEKKLPDQARVDMLVHFFELTEKAKYSESHRKALGRVKTRYLEEPMTLPKQELQTAIFRRGMEKLVNELGKDGWKDAVKENFKAIGIDLEGQAKNLLEVLEIPRLKKELSALRKSRNVTKISDKEREIAGKIQQAVSSMPYKHERDKYGSFPSSIIKGQYVDCLGASILGGKLLEEAGINYLVGALPHHSVTLLLTADEKVYFQDFTPEMATTFEIDDTKVRRVSNDKKGESLTTKDILSYARNPSKDGMLLSLDFVAHGKKEWYLMDVLPPEKGQQIQMMINVAYDILLQEGKRNEAVLLLENIRTLDKNIPTSTQYRNMSSLYLHDGQNEKALDAIKLAIKLDSGSKRSYDICRQILEKVDNSDQSIDLLKDILEKAPDQEWAYNALITALETTGRIDEAQMYLNRLIDLYSADDKQS